MRTVVFLLIVTLTGCQVGVGYGAPVAPPTVTSSTPVGANMGGNDPPQRAGTVNAGTFDSDLGRTPSPSPSRIYYKQGERPKSNNEQNCC